MQAMKSIFLFVTISLFSSQLSMAQKQLTAVDPNRFYELPTYLIKNKGLKVTADKTIQDAGIQIKQIGFRKEGFRNSTQLFIQFHCESGAQLQLGAVLFSADKNEYWSSTFEGKRQPLQRNLFSVTFPFEDITFLPDSRLTIWLTKPLEKIPYEMWEWQDEPPSKWLVGATAIEKTPPPSKDENIFKFKELDTKPMFPGGNNAMFAFIGKNLKYPSDIERSAIQGKVVVKFVVRPDGSIDQIEILKTLGASFDKAVIHAIKKMPKWSPGIIDGKAVPTQMVLPVKFKI